MEIRKYIPINSNAEKTFQDELCSEYSNNILDSYKKGKENYVSLHINSCTLISRCTNSDSLKKLKEDICISGDSLLQVKMTKILLEERLNYELNENHKKNE